MLTQASLTRKETILKPVCSPTTSVQVYQGWTLHDPLGARAVALTGILSSLNILLSNALDDCITRGMLYDDAIVVCGAYRPTAAELSYRTVVVAEQTGLKNSPLPS